MLQGQWIVAHSGSPTSINTEWFSRQRMNAVMTYELIKSVGSPTVTVDIYHKSEDQVGNGDLITGLSWTTSSGMTFAEVPSLKEMVRFRVTLTSSSGQQAALIRILPPTWFDTVHSS